MNSVIRYEAAGGVVIAGEKMLLLDRPSRNEVRLPKGHIDEGEVASEAALRETTEESGYADLAIIGELGDQTVEFDYDGKHIIRHETYFLMKLIGERLVERSEKDAAQFHILWADLNEAPELLTFPAEQTIARRAIELLAEQRTAN